MSKCESGSGEPVSTTLSLSLLNWIEWADIVYLSLFDMLVVVSRLLTLPTKCSTAGWGEALCMHAVLQDQYLISSLYYGAVKCLNLIGWRTIWGVQLFSGKRTANVVPGTALHVYITLQNDLRYFKVPYSLKQQKKQNPQWHWPNK